MGFEQSSIQICCPICSIFDRSRDSRKMMTDLLDLKIALFILDTHTTVKI